MGSELPKAPLFQLVFPADQNNCRNLTIATFAEDALYKKEAYMASLSAGKILNDHGVPVAYKSVRTLTYPLWHLTDKIVQDHGGEDTHAKYLL